MSKESKQIMNEAVMLVSCPPIALLVFSCFLSLVLNLNHGGFAEDDWGRQYLFENRVHLNPPLSFLFLLPYAALFYFKDNENIFFPTKFVICFSLAVSIASPFFAYLDWHFFFLVFVITGVSVYGLFWKASVQKKVDYGEYPLTVDPKGRRGFPTSSLHENVQIVGGTGTGKTHYVIKPFIEQTIRQDLGCFIYDVKGNMDKDVAFYTSEVSREYYHFNLIYPDMSHSYNPLYGDNPTAIANRAYTALFYDTTNAEPYYLQLAEAFLRNLIGLLKKEIQTLTFQDLLLATQETDTFKTISWFCAKYPDNDYARYFRDQWLNKSPKERRTELSGLVNKLQRFCTCQWSSLVNVRDPDIKMEEAISYGRIILFSPDSARYPEDAKALSILAMMDMAEQLSDRYRRTTLKPFRVFLDEFYNLAYPRFIDFINKCREAQINLFLAHQSLGDLRGVSKEFLEQVMNTASNKIILRVNDPDTAESFARQFGTERDQNYRVDSYQSNGTSSGYSKPPVEKFKFHPNLIKEMKTGRAIVKVVTESGVHIFKTALKFATKAPEHFSPFHSLHDRHRRTGQNESSIPDLVKPVDEGPEKGPKKSNSLGDE